MSRKNQKPMPLIGPTWRRKVGIQEGNILSSGSFIETLATLSPQSTVCLLLAWSNAICVAVPLQRQKMIKDKHVNACRDFALVSYA